jgi:hypothetical protein
MTDLRLQCCGAGANMGRIILGNPEQQFYAGPVPAPWFSTNRFEEKLYCIKQYKNITLT